MEEFTVRWILFSHFGKAGIVFPSRQNGCIINTRCLIPLGVFPPAHVIILTPSQRLCETWLLWSSITPQPAVCDSSKPARKVAVQTSELLADSGLMDFGKKVGRTSRLGREDQCWAHHECAQTALPPCYCSGRQTFHQMTCHTSGINRR